MRGQQVQEPTTPEPVRPEYAPAGEGSLRTVNTATAFAIGERVRAKDMSRAGYSRLPRYVRGHSGVVEFVQPPAVLPDTNAHFRGENPQYVYTVRFDSHELWGGDGEPFTLTIEMFESYLEKTA
jgi:nitrile hydratase